jgi:hypothetical protein
LSPKETDRLIIMLSLIPGEHQRWQRLLNVMEVSARDYMQRCISDVLRHRDVTRFFSVEDWEANYWSNVTQNRGDAKAPRAWQRLPDWKASTPLMRPFDLAGLQARYLLESNMLLENQRRATHLRLRLIAWRLQHGAYPTTSEWREVHGGQEPLLDVLSGKPFTYLPDGADVNAAKYFLAREPLGGFYADASRQPLLASPEALRTQVHGGLLQHCVYPLPPQDVVLQLEARRD